MSMSEPGSRAADIVVGWRESRLNMKYWLPGIRMYLDRQWAAGGG